MGTGCHERYVKQRVIAPWHDPQIRRQFVQEIPGHYKSAISSSNAIERVNGEVDRRAKVVSIFPIEASLVRLGTAVLQEQHDELQEGKKAFSLASMKLVLAPADVGSTNLLREDLVA